MRAFLAVVALIGFSSVADAVVEFADGLVRDAARDRFIPYRVYYDPAGPSGPMPVILVSHGGTGSDTGFTRAEHLGSTFAEAGYLAIHIGHRESVTTDQHQVDRPADVSFVLDGLESGTFPLPADIPGNADVTRVGHIGHSFGAYTSNAVAGAVFTQGSFRDERVDAIVALSPQGAGQFGAIDVGPEINSWAAVDIPVFSLVGSEEVDENALGVFFGEDWRLSPHRRYDFGPPRYLAILPGAEHNSLWSGGLPREEAYIAENATVFFDIYVRGRPVPSRRVGATSSYPGIEFERKAPDADGNGERDIFDVLTHLKWFDAEDSQAETTSDSPPELTAEDTRLLIDILSATK